MATLVRDTSAGQSVKAFVVLDKRGEHVATVHAHFANSGRVTVDVRNHGKAADRCLAAAVKSGHVTPSQLVNAITKSEAKRADWGKQDHAALVAYDLFGLQQGSASGGGYDKEAAALSGNWIDGILLTDHCGSDAKSQRMMRAYVKDVGTPYATMYPKEFRSEWNRKAERIGASFANWSDTHKAYTSLHVLAGLDRLKGMGYTVIQAI